MLCACTFTCTLILLHNYVYTSFHEYLASIINFQVLSQCQLRHVTWTIQKHCIFYSLFVEISLFLLTCNRVKDNIIYGCYNILLKCAILVHPFMRSVAYFSIKPPTPPTPEKTLLIEAVPCRLCHMACACTYTCILGK